MNTLWDNVIANKRSEIKCRIIINEFSIVVCPNYGLLQICWKLIYFCLVSTATSTIRSTFEYFDISLSVGMSCLVAWFVETKIVISTDQMFQLATLFDAHSSIPIDRTQTKAGNSKVFCFFFAMMLETSVKQCKTAKMQANE